MGTQFLLLEKWWLRMCMSEFQPSQDI